jgi:hypothetical protein
MGEIPPPGAGPSHFKFRQFVGFTVEEAAEVLSISGPTAKRWWTYAWAWLLQEIATGQTR